MSRPEKSIDESVDQVLAGIRGPQPSPDLALRIQRAAEKPSAARQRRSSRRTLPRLRLWAVGPIRLPTVIVGLSFASLAILFATLALHRSVPKRSPLSDTAKASTQPVATYPPLRQKQALPAPIQASRRGRPRTLELVSRAPQEESLAMEEMEAPSLVAPPLPMTAQERALSRLSQRHRPDAMAAVNAELRAHQQAEATTNFYDFFEPAKPAKSNN